LAGLAIGDVAVDIEVGVSNSTGVIQIKVGEGTGKLNVVGIKSHVNSIHQSEI
jgi:hypothetical protein